MSKNDEQGFQLELARILDRGRNIRFITICATVVCGITILTVGYVVRTRTPWVEIVLAIVAALIGPSGVIIVLMKSRQRYIDKHHRRMVELETKLDSSRESSSEPQR